MSTFSLSRIRHAQYKTDEGSLAAHAAHTWVTVWDDHEFANNAWFGGAENHQPATEGDWFVRKVSVTSASDSCVFLLVISSFYCPNFCFERPVESQTKPYREVLIVKQALLPLEEARGDCQGSWTFPIYFTGVNCSYILTLHLTQPFSSLLHPKKPIEPAFPSVMSSSVPAARLSTNQAASEGPAIPP